MNDKSAFADSQFANHRGLEHIEPKTKLPFIIPSKGEVDLLLYWLENKYEYAPLFTSERYPLIQAIEDLFEELAKLRRTINDLISGGFASTLGLRSMLELLIEGLGKEQGAKAYGLIKSSVATAFGVIDNHVLQRAQALKQTYAAKAAKLIRKHQNDIVFISLVNFYHQERIETMKQLKNG